MRDSLTSLDSALAAVLAQARTLDGSERVSTFDADGRVLLAQAVSPLQVPPHDNSAMDGYAVRSSDIAAAGTLLPVSQRIAAGQMGSALAAGTAARIFTGAPLPARLTLLDLNRPDAVADWLIAAGARFEYRSLNES